jgi:thiopeptide-type bacteriocin biosynthesis protein
VDTSVWQQANLTFADPALAERTAVTHVIPILTAAETHRLISAWFVVRKGHQWRLRYLPTHAAARPTTKLRGQLHHLCRSGHLTTVTHVIYEPETIAFGGPRAMRLAHRLWHLDSRHLLTPPPAQPRHTRELSILQCTAMMRAAGLDWYEQGDVWARAADHRDPADPTRNEALHDAVRRLLVVDPASLTHAGAPLAAATTWIDAFATTGAALRRTHDSGHLLRGLRDVLTHHVIFTWNRRGLPDQDQAAFAAAARDVIFGPQPPGRLPLSETAAA